MTEELPTTQSAALAGIETELPRLIETVAGGHVRVLIQQGVTPVAALIGTRDLARLQQMDDEDREAWEILEAMRAPFQDVSPETIERETAKAIADIRAERKAGREAARKVG